MAINEAADAHIFFADFAEAATITPIDDVPSTANIIVDKGLIRDGSFESTLAEAHTEITVAKSVRDTWLRGDIITVGDVTYRVKRMLDDDGVVVVLHVDGD